MNHTDIINYLAEKNNFKSYLEIGVGNGENFHNINIQYKECCDMTNEHLAYDVSINYIMTSNEMFDNMHISKKFDLIFIDGLHLEKQVDKDIINSLKHLNKNGLILIHDVNINFNVKKGIYFKRELSNNIYVKNIHNLKILPISFCIPKSKFMNINFNKTNLIVGLSNQYVFSNELNYYTNYNNSYFGFTKKKNGWDCLRHYEIIAAGCLPFFLDYETCPKYTMYNWPNGLQFHANQLCQKYCKPNYNSSIYYEYYRILGKFYNYAYDNLTTEAMANYIIYQLY